LVGHDERREVDDPFALGVILHGYAIILLLLIANRIKSKLKHIRNLNFHSFNNCVNIFTCFFFYLSIRNRALTSNCLAEPVSSKRSILFSWIICLQFVMRHPVSLHFLMENAAKD